MKKIIFPALFVCVASLTYGQSIKKVNSYLEKKDFANAKTEIDAFLAKKPDDAEGNYLKSKIYEDIADSAAIRSLVQGDARELALEAFKKAIADSSNTKIKLMIMKDNYSPVFKMYSGYYSDAAEAFNQAAGSQNKEDFTKAMNLFSKANEIGQYIGTSGWATIPELDTTLVLNIGKAAINAGNSEMAEKVFKQLADAKIRKEKGADDYDSYRIPYQWLTLHYKEAKDEANMIKYATLGKEAFPEDDYFDFVLMDYYREKKDMPGVFARYQELVNRNPDSLHYHFNYANELFGYVYNSDDGVVVENKQDYLNTLTSELEKAYGIDAKDINTNWLYSQSFYNKGIELRDEALKIKGTKPEDVSKKTELMNQAKENFNKAVPYAKTALSELEASGKTSDKSRFKSIANLMQNIYQSLGDKENLKVYQDLYDTADAKFTKG